jgi:hypothetical protein
MNDTTQETICDDVARIQRCKPTHPLTANMQTEEISALPAHFRLLKCACDCSSAT